MENNMVVFEEKRAKLATQSAIAIKVLSLDGVNDVNELKAYASVADTNSEFSLLVKAKAFGKIRDAFIAEKERVSALRKARKKGDPIPQVNLYGYSTFVDYAEKELRTPKTTANNLANIARFIVDNGLATVFISDLKVRGQGDFTFSQLTEIAPLGEDKIREKIASKEISSTMTARELREARQARKNDITDEVKVTEAANVQPTEAANVQPTEAANAQPTEAANAQPVKSPSVILARGEWDKIVELLIKAGEKTLAGAIAVQVKGGVEHE